MSKSYDISKMLGWKFQGGSTDALLAVATLEGNRRIVSLLILSSIKENYKFRSLLLPLPSLSFSLFWGLSHLHSKSLCSKGGGMEALQMGYKRWILTGQVGQLFEGRRRIIKFWEKNKGPKNIGDGMLKMSQAEGCSLMTSDCLIMDH